MIPVIVVAIYLVIIAVIGSVAFRKTQANTEDFFLAIVEVDGESAVPRYVRRPFQKDLDFGVTSVNFSISKLLAKIGENEGNVA